MTGSVRLIKKYPNRRLYDTKTSSYITLVDVKELVVKNEEFQVIDAKSGDDLTRSILLQIILDEEGGGAPMFSSDVLTQFIRFYGSAMQEQLQNQTRTMFSGFPFPGLVPGSKEAATTGAQQPGAQQPDAGASQKDARSEEG